MKFKSLLLSAAMVLSCIPGCRTAMPEPQDSGTHYAADAVNPYIKSGECPGAISILYQNGKQETALLGYADAEKKIPVFLAANYSLGIATLTDLVKRAAALYPDGEIEIVEQHHDRKLDAPSGTALALFNAVKEVRPSAEANCGRAGQGKRTKDEVGIHAVRMGNIVGIHEVMIGTQNERITLKHEAFSRGVFAEGSLKAAAFLIGKKPGHYDMKDMLAEV